MISSVPWLTLRSAPVRADVLWVAAVVQASCPAPPQVVVKAEAAAVLLEQSLGFSSEGAVGMPPAAAPDWATLSCRWAESPEQACPCSRSTVARFS